jgi:hypothetical protein
MSHRLLVVASLILVTTQPLVGAGDDHELWIPVVAHRDGDDNSHWRSDVSLLNLCTASATVELRLHADGTVSSETYEVGAGRQQVIQDVVGQLVDQDTGGSLEVLSDQELVVTSRTYNLTDNGTYGQSLPAIRPGKGLDSDDDAYLPQLKQNDTFRSNIGLVNMGSDTATVTVTLYDTTGAEVGDLEFSIAAGEMDQSNSPYQRRFDRTDIVAGFARVLVEEGNNVWAYGSVVDGRTGDPTTIAMDTWDGECDTNPALDDFFSLDEVHEVAIDVGESGEASLLAEPRQWVPASLTIDDTSFATVGVRLKGGAGSFIPLDGDYPEVSGDGNGNPGKSAFIIDFNRYQSGVNFLGLKKLTINNLVQDDSGIHEFLGYSLFREGGVPASRSGYGMVTFNGEEKGLYALIEATDNDLFLDLWYDDDDGNLYEGEYGADLRQSSIDRFDQDNGDDESKADLATLVAALDAIPAGSDATSTLDQLFDLDTVLTFFATELYLGHWDGYAWSANNYFIHHELEDDTWFFMPWGIDQLFIEELGPYSGVMTGAGPSWNHGGRIQALCIGSPLCRSRLSEAFSDVIERVEEMDLAGLAEEARDLVEPLLLAESTAYGDPDLTYAALDQVESFIDQRGAAIEAWLPCLTGGSVDNDGDTYNACTVDCDDSSASVHPGAAETCNLVDDDCNGAIDDAPGCPQCLEENGPGGIQYAFCFGAKTWLEARAACQSDGRDLASIHDGQTFDFLSFTFLERLGTMQAWIGLNDIASEGTFSWSDGSSLDFLAWTSDSPKPEGMVEDCVVNAFFGWSDLPCDLAFPYICR